MRQFSENGIEYHCKMIRPFKARACDLKPITGVDDQTDVNQAIEEIRQIFNPKEFTVTWRSPPDSILVKIYMQGADLVIEGSETDFGNLYCACYPVGHGAYVSNTRQYLGITKQAIPVFTRILENATDAGTFLGAINWFHNDDGTAIFSWLGPVKKCISITESISRRGNVAISDRMFTLVE